MVNVTHDGHNWRTRFCHIAPVSRSLVLSFFQLVFTTQDNCGPSQWQPAVRFLVDHWLMVAIAPQFHHRFDDLSL